MEIGDHLVSPRIGYDHHGLYMGGGKVIHYSGFSEVLDKGSIEITSINDFTQGNGCYVKSHLVAIYDAEERIERAYSKLGEDSYNLIFNNCEHFVNWCFYGFKTSSQVNDVVSTVAIATNGCLKRKGTEAVVSTIIEQISRDVTKKAAGHVLTSASVKSVASIATSTAAGVAASTVTGTTAAGVVSALAAKA